MTATGRPQTGRPQTDYRGHFERSEAVADYLRAHAGPRSGPDAAAWLWQRRYLRQTLQRRFGAGLHARRALDYACGAGRVLGELAGCCAEVHGWDSSAAMLRECRRAVPAAALRRVDLSAPAGLEAGPPPGRFDVITAFRLLLNLEPDRRLVILRSLAELLADGGLLVIDNHGNRHSLRHLALRLSRRRQPGFDNELADRELRALLAAAGLRVLARAGFGWLPEVLHRNRRTGPLARRVDGFLLSRTRTPWLAIRVMYVTGLDPAVRSHAGEAPR
jgi:SAM-dependent methyltransferase